MGADIFLSLPPHELISPYKKNREYRQKIVKIKKLDIFLHILPHSNQSHTENTDKNIELSIFLHKYLHTKWRQSLHTTRQRRAQRFREQKDQPKLSVKAANMFTCNAMQTI